MGVIKFHWIKRRYKTNIYLAVLSFYKNIK